MARRDPTPLPVWGAYIRFERTVPERNVRREYALYVGPDLFGGWALLRTWGRTGGFQRSVARCFTSRENAKMIAERIARRRLSRGYRIVACG